MDRFIEKRRQKIVGGHPTLKGFQKQLSELINNPDMKRFENLLWYCPYPKKHCHIDSVFGFSSTCFLSDKNGPEELRGQSDICLINSISQLCSAYNSNIISKKTALSKVVLLAIKLLAYLNSKETEK